MDKNKGKSVTTSVPSISIKFHANAEQIEEFYTSEDENNVGTEKADRGVTFPSSSPLNIDQENSPLKLIPKLVKRSTSIDVGHTQQLDASPPSDPWRFFSDIKGKITKSVEDKITEIKARNNEEGSPQHRAKLDKTSELKTIKDSKENSSVSDSEDLSESSISRTCGIVSTTEGVEMSSDEDTPSLDKDQKINKDYSSLTTGLRHRFRFLRSKVESEEGFVKTNDLSKLYNINVENNDQVLPTEDAGDVESAVDALEDEDLKNGDNTTNTTGEEVLQKITERIANIELDEENGVKITEVTGTQIRDEFFDCRTQVTKTVFAPSGFVDLRPMITETRRVANYVQLLVIFLAFALYFILHYFSPFLGGLAAGAIVCFIYFQIYLKLTPLSPIKNSSLQKLTPQLLPNKILEVQAVKEYQPLQKYEGWANEYPDAYSPETYHISRTQSVYLRLQGNLLRLSHSRSKVPKRAMWNESEIVANFTHHRIYNLIGAKITLLPEGLTKKRLWSKKYPICITLSKDQMCFDSEVLAKLESEDEKNLDRGSDKEKESAPSRYKKTFGRFRKKEYPVMAQRFSKLNEDNFDLDSDSRASTPSGEFSDVPDSPGLGDEDLPAIENNGGEMELPPDDICLNRCLPKETDPSEITLYLFGRTDREKEDWFRRLMIATHKEIGVMSTDANNLDDIKEPIVANPLIVAAEAELEYLKYMNVYKTCNKSQKTSVDKLDKPEEQEESTDHKREPILWLNALIGRVLFDCVRDSSFISKVKDRIERKLSTIKLPYFIEELLVPELSLGKTAPFIKKTGKPLMDDRGLWIDLDIVYEGLIVLTLQTKLNLMRLKNPQAYEKRPTPLKLAIYNSDIDDSAESSSDEDGPQEVSTILNDSSGKTSESGGKKFIRMVDKIAESKFFQVATDNRYIKKAMEGVSNTDLRLTVEVKSIVGTLVLNIPPPPSDRIWLGFRPIPEILLSARPIVGERHVSYMIVTNWIEKKLVQEFQKVMVIPNMEDFAIPVMNPKLPE